MEDDVGSKDEVNSMDEEVEGSRLVEGLVETEVTVGGDVSAVVLDDGADVEGESEKVVGEGEDAALVLVEFPDIVNRRSKVSLCGFLFMAVSVQANLHDVTDKDKDNGDNVLMAWMRSLPSTEPDFPRPVSGPDIAMVVFDRKRDRKSGQSQTQMQRQRQREMQS
jgi:hypothetical protein